MYIFKEKKALESFLGSKKKEGAIGFVPTMGALHSGHASLIQKSLKENKTTICSVFVNPTQFNQKEDYDKYPQVLEKDIVLLEEIGTQVLYAPSVKEMYPSGLGQLNSFEIGSLEHILEGEFRPGHFQGVCHIVNEFLLTIQPDNLYMGEKDFQQVAVIRKMLEITGSKTQLISCPTERAPSGLALSSRNARLSPEGIEKAAALNRALEFIKSKQLEQSFSQLKSIAEDQLKAHEFTLEYIALCNAQDLSPLEDFEPGISMRLIAAAHLEGVRLIDNIGL